MNFIETVVFVRGTFSFLDLFDWLQTIGDYSIDHLYDCDDAYDTIIVVIVIPHQRHINIDRSLINNAQEYWLISTGVDLSKILGETKYWEVTRVSLTDEIMGVSQWLGARALTAPKVYAYMLISFEKYLSRRNQIVHHLSITTSNHAQWRRPGAEFGGDGKMFRGPRFLNDVFLGKNSIFTAKNFWWPFFL